MENPTLLDASALIALARKEPGHEVLLKVCEAGLSATIPTALAEAIYVCSRKKKGISAEEFTTLLSSFSVAILDIGADDGEVAAFIASKVDEHNAKSKKPLSVGVSEALLLAVSLRTKRVAVFAEDNLKYLELEGLQIQAFR